MLAAFFTAATGAAAFDGAMSAADWAAGTAPTTDPVLRAAPLQVWQSEV